MNRWHRILALLVGLQMLIWVVTGLGLGLLPTPPTPVVRTPEPLDAQKLVLPQPPAGAGSVGAITLLGKTRILVDGQVLTPMTQGDAQLLLAQYFPGKETGPLERLDHGWRTTLPGHFVVTLGDDGKIKTNQYWLTPVLLRLHFMDWFGNGSNFNQPLIKLASIIAMLLIGSGLGMAIRRLWQRRRSTKVALVGFPIDELTPGRGTLAQRLAKAGMPVTGPCDGGGRCGGCAVRLNTTGKPLTVSAAERRLISDDALAEGVRLACQQLPSEGCTLTALDKSQSVADIPPPEVLPVLEEV
ncbi:2Fe-2S iron-sulfur cluster-binding protein [Gallaecimonas mangrovi]|uniref:2Fe-2S iron-sulfur cluster-binding protein n=1 Tax=Gallaecimonas mangrovi TaxID=2291597 RepID=UPI000E2011F2|nr:2Fe-2S iron-sulfur cluster-binding protein [Gallaecimonas mangrovi]